MLGWEDRPQATLLETPAWEALQVLADRLALLEMLELVPVLLETPREMPLPPVTPTRRGSFSTLMAAAALTPPTLTLSLAAVATLPLTAVRVLLRPLQPSVQQLARESVLFLIRQSSRSFGVSPVGNLDTPINKQRTQASPQKLGHISHEFLSFSVFIMFHSAELDGRSLQLRLVRT
jgi:hypothetical protein